MVISRILTPVGEYILFQADTATFFLTFIAVVIAILAYQQSIIARYQNLKSVVRAFQAELDYAKNWIGARYPANYHDAEWWNPHKQVYPLHFTAGPELLKIGGFARTAFGAKIVQQKKIVDTLARFLERAEAFNRQVDHIHAIVASNSVLAEKLWILYRQQERAAEKCGGREKDKKTNLFFYFNNRMRTYECCDNQVENLDERILLAFALYKANEVLHIQLIGSENEYTELSAMYRKLQKGVAYFEQNYNKTFPSIWFRPLGPRKSSE